MTFPPSGNSHRSARRHFRSRGIRIAPHDGISAAGEFTSLRATAFPQKQLRQIAPNCAKSRQIAPICANAAPEFRNFAHRNE
jgi:hypothetical protein